MGHGATGYRELHEPLIRLTASDGRENRDFITIANGVIAADNGVIYGNAKSATIGELLGEHIVARTKL
jgi:hypothetical protein